LGQDHYYRSSLCIGERFIPELAWYVGEWWPSHQALTQHRYAHVRFCTDKEMEAYRQEEWMQGFEATGKQEVNLYVFRHYVEYYLRHHPKVHQELTMMVRQLQPTPEGLPIELYFFSDGTTWVPYERLQAEVFDHLLAVLPNFGLKVFQSPTGLDLQMLKS